MPPVASKQWSCTTLSDGIHAVQAEAQLHLMDEEERALLEEIQAERSTQPAFELFY